MIPEAKKAAEAEKAEAEKKAISGTFIMTVGHLSWGLNGKSHFYADKKPIINAKVMGTYTETLKLWIKAGWVIKGSYK